MQQKVEIRVRGQIDKAWSEWFHELHIEHGAQENETILTGCVPDQAALYGLLAKLRDIGLELISFESERVKEEQGGKK
jgi:ppGpp synthetase/RelA/SpoT-type nucleotidyltranferase